MKKPRHLSPEDRAVWDAFARRVTPMHPASGTPTHDRKTKPLPKPKTVVPQPRLAPFSIGAKAQTTETRDVLPGITSQLRSAPVQMDSKAFGKMTRGKLKPEARIDLHGMTLDEAYPELKAFILRAHETGKRLVLVITGKGKRKDDSGPIPARVGILRHHVPQWLAQMPMRTAVMEVRPAHLRHGGEGAYYVYLRRNR